MKVTCAQPWLAVDLGAPHQVLSWCPYRPGLVLAERILWREVRNADLTEEFDAETWLAEEVAEQGAAPAVCFLTSRDIRHHHYRKVTVEGVTVEALATVGLGNIEAVGSRRVATPASFGSINIAVQVHAALSQSAQLEALSIITEARTAAILAEGHILPGGIASGTGTDCIALASAQTGPELAFAGLHTALGEAIGRAVLEAVSEGARTEQISLTQAAR